MIPQKILSNKLIRKLFLTFLCIIIAMGGVFVFATLHLSQKFHNEASQKLHANIANHLVEEKFKNAAPFLENGEVNKILFNDIMHDMMAVNRAIEVYLLNSSGEILHSVVLDHSNTTKPLTKVNLTPINEFINNNKNYILGDDPKNINNKKIFSAAHFQKNGIEGYIYIVLSGGAFEKINKSLFSSYFTTLVTTISLITMFFSILIGWLSIYYITKNLRTIIFHVNRFSEGYFCSRIKNAENSNLSGLAVTFNKMADTISKNIEEMKSADIIRRELIANISHDLKTPLTIMYGYIETLQIKQNTINSQNSQKYIKIIENSVTYLKKLVFQLSEYSKLEAKQVIPKILPFLIADLIIGLKDRYHLLLLEKEIEFNIQIENEKQLVLGDPTLIERVLLNIMDNAIKFNPQKGKIHLSVYKENDHVKIKINDSGPGINEDEKEFIFDRFNQSKSDYKNDGMGLGLAIVKKIIELHNTEIIVKRGLNNGAIFEFSLPSYINVTNVITKKEPTIF